MPHFVATPRRLTARFCVPVVLSLCAWATAEAAAAGVWVRQRSPSLAWLKSVHFIDARRGWAAGGGGTLLRTTDGGTTWQVSPRATEDMILSVRFANETHGWLLCEPALFSLKRAEEPRSYVLRTTDGGATWTRADPTIAEPSLRLTRLAFIDENTGWAFGETGSIYSTADGGATWTRRNFASRLLLLGGAFLDARQGWLVGAGGIVWRTADGGATWRESRVRPRPEGQITTRASATGAGRDAGQQAGEPTLIGAGGRLHAVAFVDARQGWTVGAGGQIWMSANGGSLWTPQASNTDADLLDIALLDRNIGWAVGTNGTILSTTNGGRVWTSEPTRVAHRLESVCVVPGGHAWAVGFGGTILRREPNRANTRPELKIVN